MSNRILIVDDNPAIHGDFAKILLPGELETTSLDATAARLFNLPVKTRRQPEVELCHAHSGEEALAIVKKSREEGRPFAMAFMDVQMSPGWDGVETSLHLWDVDPDLQIVLCTAYSDYSWTDISARFGCTDRALILKKPFEAIEVLQMAVSMLKKWSVTQEARLRMQGLDKLVEERTRHLEEQVAARLSTEERFSLAFHTSPLAMAILRLPDLSVVDANACFTSLTGVTAGLAGLAELLPESQSLCGRLSSPDEMRSERLELRGRSGVKHTVLVSRETFQINEVGHMLVMVEDVTERLLQEDRLRQSHKMDAVGQLAAGIAHDFNNIMTVILGRVSEHVEDSTLTEELRDSLREVLGSGARAAELTRQLLAFGRRQALAAEPVSLDGLVASEGGKLAGLVSGTCVLDWQIDCSLPAILADRDALHHILRNLVLNAQDAMPKGGRITIGARLRQSQPGLAKLETPLQHVCLYVRDEGAGMTDAVKAHIFEPFFTTKEVGQGSGLGLPMVYGLVSQLMGWIEVNSEPGAGSEFCVYLPATVEAPPAAATGAVRVFAPACGQGVTALIVEDDAPLRRMLCSMVRRSGFIILEAGSADEALEIWNDGENSSIIDLVITDVVMPGSLSGLNLGGILNKIRPDLKIVYSTGYSAEMLGGGETLFAMQNFLPKPYEISALTAMLQKLFPGGLEGYRNHKPGDLALSAR